MARFGGKVLVCLALLGAIAFVAAEDCQTAACKSLSDELLHRSMKLTADPCDDFYTYACGEYEKFHPLSPTTSVVNSFALRGHEVQHEINDAIKAAHGSPSHAVTYLESLYLECNNTATQESRSTKPLLDQLQSVLGGWPLLKKTHTPSGKKWSQIFTQVFSHTGLSGIFQIAVQFERHLGQKYLFIAPGGTAISPSVLLTPTTHKAQLDAYRAYFRQSAILLGAEDNAKLTQDIERVIHLETEIAKAHQQAPLNMIRLGTFAGLNTATKNSIDWVEAVNSILTATKSTLPHFKATDHMAAVNLDYLHLAAQVLDGTPEEVIENLFGWLLVAVFGPLTTHQFRHNEAAYRKVVTGVSAEPPTPEFCYSIANSKLPFAVGRVYVDSHFTPADKKEAEILVHEIKSSFRKALQANDWLDEETRELALKKLDAIKENIAYPEWVISNTDLDSYYSHLKQINVQAGKFFESAVELNTLTVRHGFDTIHVPINHTLLWPMTPATVNAAYMPTENSITIPAAVLHSPFFDKSRPFSMNYGAIGAIIGHEMTHGFDNNGRRFDATGKQTNWWSQETLAEFNDRANCLVKQYSAILDPQANLHLNGQRTLGENIADNGGVKEAFAAFHSHQNKTGASPTLPGLKLNADQLFFVSYARNWCSVHRTEQMKLQILSNPHAPDRYRVNLVVENSPEFAKAFNCAATSKMNPAHKCAVW